MVVITFLVLGTAVWLLGYWLGRGRRLNHKIKHSPDDIAVNVQTGEVIERGTPEWRLAEKQGKVEFR